MPQTLLPAYAMFIVGWLSSCMSMAGMLYLASIYTICSSKVKHVKHAVSCHQLAVRQGDQELVLRGRCDDPGSSISRFDRDMI